MCSSSQTYGDSDTPCSCWRDAASSDTEHPAESLALCGGAISAATSLAPRVPLFTSTHC